MYPRLIGSPPGYVGYEEGGQLSDKVRRTHPYSVILFDEIEKAHPDVFNILLQVLDDGHITDAQGRVVDFSNTDDHYHDLQCRSAGNHGSETTWICMSKNDKADDYKRMKAGCDGRSPKMIFKPEFLNRIDEIMVFHVLNKEDIRRRLSLCCAVRHWTKRCQDTAGYSA